MLKRPDMPYTCAFIEETLRFRTLGPLGLFHCTTEDSVLGKYEIPKGTMVIIFFFLKLSLEISLFSIQKRKFWFEK